MSSKIDAFTIVSATKNDAELLKAIHQECFANYWNTESFNDFFTIDGTVALVAQMVLGSSPLVLGKEKSSTKNQVPSTPALGMVIHRVQHEQADIITIAVLPEYRRRGIAHALVNASLEKAIAQGVQKMFLDVEENNLAAIALYEQFGFTHLRRRKQYYRQKDGSFTDALVMQRKL